MTKLMIIQGVSSFLPPIISPCARIQKNNRVLNWPPPKMVESRTCHPQKLQSLIEMTELTELINLDRSERFDRDERADITAS